MRVTAVTLDTIRYGDTVEQSTSTFPARFAPMILANRVASRSMYGEAVVTSLARIEREKVHVNCISVSDGIKLNKQRALFPDRFAPMIYHSIFITLLML